MQGDGRWYEPFPLFIKRAQGSRIWDVDGNEYLDYHASYGPAVLGYNDARVRAAVVDALDHEGVLFGAPHPKEVELAKLLAELIPCAEMTVLCGGGGSDATYNAIRVARAYTGRKKVLKFEGGYHGCTTTWRSASVLISLRKRQEITFTYNLEHAKVGASKHSAPSSESSHESGSIWMSAAGA